MPETLAVMARQSPGGPCRGQPQAWKQVAPADSGSKSDSHGGHGTRRPGKRDQGPSDTWATKPDALVIPPLQSGPVESPLQRKLSPGQQTRSLTRSW